MSDKIRYVRQPSAESAGEAPGRGRLNGRRILVVGGGQRTFDAATDPVGNGQLITMDIRHRGAGKVTMHPFHGRGRTPCATSHTIDYRENWIRISIPRTCLDDPEWVRLGVVNLAQLAPDLSCFDNVVTDGFAYATRSFTGVRLTERLYQA